MTQEEKELLLKDLCARLPYGVKVRIDFGEHCTRYDIPRYADDTVICIYPETFEIGVNDEDLACSIDDIKPYLRPMSSMTEEEKKELNNVLEFQYYSDDSCMCESTDWLNARHFDYRGLIPMGLALEVPEGMYKNE